MPPPHPLTPELERYPLRAVESALAEARGKSPGWGTFAVALASPVEAVKELASALDQILADD